MRFLFVLVALLFVLLPSLSLPTPTAYNATSLASALGSSLDPFLSSPFGSPLGSSFGLPSPLPTPPSGLLPRDAPTRRPPFQHGSCGIHVTQKQSWMDFRADAPRGEITATVFSPAGAPIGFLPPTIYVPRQNISFCTGVPDHAFLNDDWTVRNAAGRDGPVPKLSYAWNTKLGVHDEAGRLRMTVRAGLWVDFEVGGDRWRSGDPGRCRVGEWDRVFWYMWDFKNPRRDMDCGFAC